MARRTTTTIEEDSGNESSRESIGNVAVETIETVEESAAERIEALMSREGADPVSRIYREDLRKNESSTPREYLSKYYGYAGEDYLAEHYGGGRYVVRYQWKQEGVLKKSSLSFAISNECKPRITEESSVQPVQPKSGLASILDGLTNEKVAAIAGTVGLIRDILTPKNDAMTELVKILAANNRQSVGDAVLIEALKSNRPEPPRQSLISQIKEFQEASELIRGNEIEESSGGSKTMDYVNMGMNILSMLLKKNNNDFQAVGQEVRDNTFVNELIRDDKELAQKFITAAKEKYGEQAAMALANGFGYSYGVQSQSIPDNSEQIQQG